MAHPIQIPRLGWSMEEGIFIEWLKQDGDRIEPGDLLYNLEGEKAIQEIESIDARFLRIPDNAPAEGETVLVGQVIGWLCAEDEAVPELPVTTVPAASVAPAATPAAVPANIRSAEPATRPPVSTPRARRVASELGVDWTTLAGSGRNGRIRERDVRAATSGGSPVASTADTVSESSSSVRHTIANRMLIASQTTAPVTLTTTADATQLVSLRQQFQAAAADARPPGYNDLLIKLTGIVLRNHPLLRARWTENGIEVSETIDIGLAVDTEAGLIVPVVRDPGGTPLRTLCASISDLVERGRERRLTADEMSGGAFTITNLGSFGIDAFTPILNLPQSAILGIGRIRRVPAIDGDEFVARDQLALSLTFDHRVLDGATAAAFLAELVQAIETPGAMLAG